MTVQTASERQKMPFSSKNLLCKAWHKGSALSSGSPFARQQRAENDRQRGHAFEKQELH